jgi:hypothetical protein
MGIYRKANATDKCQNQAPRGFTPKELERVDQPEPPKKEISAPLWTLIFILVVIAVLAYGGFLNWVFPTFK